MHYLSALFFLLFGKFSWISPPWIQQLKKKRLTFVGLLGLIVLMVGAFLYHKNTKQTPTIAKIYPPATLQDTLIISFTKNKKAIGVAPIESLNKPINQGIELSPIIEGQWEWESDSKLAFIPKENWGADQTYQVTFNKAFFDQKASINSYFHTFSTKPLRLDISHLHLYQDLKSPEIQKIVGTLHFNYPIDQNSLIENIHLSFQDNGEKIPLKISFNDEMQEAFIESDPIQLPAIPRFVNLMITPGIKASKGPGKCLSILSEKCLIPDANNYFHVKNVNTKITHDKEGNPSQILTIETSLGVSADELLKSLSIQKLPNHPTRQDGSWVSLSEVTQDTINTALPLTLHPLPERHPYPTLHEFKIEASTPSFLYLQLLKGAMSHGGFVLTTDYKTIVPSPECKKEVYFLEKGSLMAKSSEKKMTIAVRGVSDVHLSIGRILPQSISHLATQSHGDFQNPYFRYGGLDFESITQIDNETRHFHITDPCELKYTSLNLDNYLQDHPFGLFFIKAQEWDVKNKTALGASSDRLILITDMDIIVKDNGDKTHDLFVHSITNGMPIQGAQVSILGKNSLPLISAQTDQDGHVNFPSLRDFKEDKTPAVYLVQNEEDISFIPYYRYDRKLDYSRFDTRGMSFPQDNALSAYVFIERNLYRPGEQVHIGAIIKNPFAKDPETKLPLEIRLIDPIGNTLMAEKRALPANDFITLDYTLPKHAKSGNYSIQVYITKNEKLESFIGSTQLKVQEFQPDRLKMTAQFIQDEMPSWLLPDHQKAKVHLSHLFGQPAVNHTVKAKMTLKPFSGLYFPSYQNYTFINSLDEERSSFAFSDTLTDGITDDQGNVEFDFNLEKFSKAAYQLDFLVEGFEGDSGRAVCQELSTLLIPHKHMIGYKTDASLDYIKQDAQASLHLIALDSQKKQVPLTDLVSDVYVIKTVSTLVKKTNGTYAYQSEKQKTLMSSQNLTITADGIDLILPTTQVGDFVLIICDSNKNLLSKAHFSVLGHDTEISSAALTVKLDKAIYEPGDVIQAHIKAPFAGTALLTIEQDRVRTYKWLKIESGTSEKSIKIPQDLQGTGYLNIALIRDFHSDEIYMNPLCYAAHPFKISNEKQKLLIDLKVPESSQAGDELAIQFSTQEPAKIVLFAVDEGILQCGGYQNPAPLTHFFPKTALMVQTLQMADLILPKYQGKEETSLPGGDQYTKLLAKNNNPFKRKSEQAVVFWSGLLDSDSTPNTIHYKIPDSFNGTLRIMAVASASNKVGSLVKTTQAKSHFSYAPNIPTFMAPGDIATIPVTITNHLNEPSEQAVAIRMIASPHIKILGHSEKTVHLIAGQEAKISFQIQAEEKLGQAEISLIAEMGHKSSQINSSVSIRPLCTLQTDFHLGYDKGLNKNIPLKTTLYQDFSEVRIDASPCPSILTAGLEEYIHHTVSECTENMIFKSCKVDELRDRQSASGGFINWPTKTEPDLFVSLLTMEYLTCKKMSGDLVPEDLFQRGLRYLEKVAQKDATSLLESEAIARAIYLLTRNGQVTTNYLTNLHLSLTRDQKNQWNKTLIPAFMAATHQLLHNSKVAHDLIHTYPLNDDPEYITLLARHFPNDLEKNGHDLINLLQKVTGDELNVKKAALTVKALAEFKPLNEASSLTIKKESDSVQIHNPRENGYFYYVNQTGFSKQAPSKPIKNGLEIFREYRDEKNLPIQSTSLGSKINAHIKTRITDLEKIHHVAIVDLLPSGFEIIPDTLKANECDFVDIQEDRLIFYCSLMHSLKEFSYQLRAINQGTYQTSPIFAEALLDKKIKGQGASGQITIR